MYVDKLTRHIAVANLIAQIGIIVTGGAVRLTGSGLGCSQWPMCEPGTFTPVFHEESTIHPYIEFGNRTLTGVLTVIAVALVVAVYRREPTRDRPEMKKLVWLPLIGIAIQAFVGGVTVWVDLHPAIVGSHMLISLALVMVSAYLIWRLDHPDTQPVPFLDQPRALASIAAIITTVLVVLGVIVTGAGPHSGDETEPYRWPMDTVLITRIHAASAWLFVIMAVAILIIVSRENLSRSTTHTQTAVKMWTLVIAAAILEGIIGYTQHFLGLPEILVGLHMLGAALIVTAVTYGCCSLYPRRDHSSGEDSSSPTSSASSLAASSS